MDIETALGGLGLNEKESKVYLALLQLGRVSAYSVAEKSGLKKPTTYVILENLIEKECVIRVPKTKKQLYLAEDPQKIVQDAQVRVEKAASMLPELEALTRKPSSKVNVMYFEGEQGVRHIFTHRLKEMRGQEAVGFFAYKAKEWSAGIKHFMEHGLFEAMQQENITIRAVAPEHPSLKFYRKTDTQYERTVKTLPKKDYSSKVSIDVLGDMTRIYDYENSQGVLIENQSVAKAVKEIFEMVWKTH